jgi:DNA-binding CsgD family transcriptional regulator
LGIEVTGLIESGRASAAGEPAELRRIQQRLAEVEASKGGVVYIEGARGSGKSELVTAAAHAARSSGMRVLDARGHALEREFPFGVALQLFEETWFAADERVRASLLEGPARAAGELMSGAFAADSGSAGERAYAVIHGLFRLARALVEAGGEAAPGPPLALIVDDVDCADGLSLRFLAYLASRIERLPIAVIVAASPAGTSADPPALSALQSAAEPVGLASPGPVLSVVPDPVPAPAVLGAPERARAEAPRAAAAELALRKSLAEGHRESVIDLAELAWGDGALLESDEAADSWTAVARALMFVDELERAVEIAQAATRSGRSAGRPGADHCCQGWSLYHQGQITAALALAEAARAAQRDDLAARGLIVACRLAQGRLDEAEVGLPSLLESGGIEEIDAVALLDLRAQLRLAQLRPADALADALDAGRRVGSSGGDLGPGVVAWRSTAALARLALGETERARGLAEEELALARERGVSRVIIRDLRVLALAAKGPRSLDLLGEAVRIGRGAGQRLEYVNALVDLGAATRRANQRTAARHPLRKGLDLAERGGAAAAARRAREELDATGARSRRVMLSGIAALTPSERRVADLAVGGLTTRQISQVLFVTPKTVEFHLRHIYRKLDIPSSRADLARVLLPAASE